MVQLRLLKFNHDEFVPPLKHKTGAIEREYIDGYPKQLWIYRQAASPFWWVRYYTNGQQLKKTTKTADKHQAIEFAKKYFDAINTNIRLGILTASTTNFRATALAVLEIEKAKIQRGEITQMTYDNFVYRFNKSVLPFFGDMEVDKVGYEVLSQYLNLLSGLNVQPVTIRSYLQIVRKVLVLANRRGVIPAVPEFPKLKVKPKARGWFTPAEYLVLYRTARRLVGVRMEIRRYVDATGTKQTQYIRTEDVVNKQGRFLCYVDMTQDVRWLLVFMINGYIRPSDIRHMQHLHVDVVRRDYTYLRLRLPESKGHTDPITTMPRAVTAYLALRRQHRIDNEGRKVQGSDYVFMPDYSDNRRHALHLLQRQFEVLMHVAGLAKTVDGEHRTLYSLRHSSIMYRLLYGDGINTLVLARNARTSVEMIDRFYAKPLSGEMNIDMLQSKRRRRGR